MCCQLIKKSQNLIMSVFCSNTLIFAPECWKCILRSPDFKIFPETHTFSAHKSCLCRKFFPSSPTPKLLPPTLNLIENSVQAANKNYSLDNVLQKFVHVQSSQQWEMMISRLTHQIFHVFG